jgi:Sec-independent protein translocase protein TatA
MISTVALFLFLGLLVFGPRKTPEIAQEVGLFVAKAKQAADQLLQSIVEPETSHPIVESPAVRKPSVQEDQTSCSAGSTRSVAE